MTAHKNRFYFLFYFVVIFLIAILYDTFHMGHVGEASTTTLHFNATLQDIKQHYGVSDQGSFARGGLTIFKKGWFDANTRYLMDVWPPGFMVLEAIILKIFGAHAPIVLILQALLSLCLATLFSLFRNTLQLFWNKYIALFIPLLLLVPMEFRYYLMAPDGTLILVGDSFAITFVLIGLFCLYSAYSKNSKKYAIIAGTLFALSAWFHSQFEMFFLVATINFLLIMTIYFFYIKIKKQSLPILFNKNYFKSLTPLTTIFIALVMFHTLTVPYRLYHYAHYHSLLWVQTSDYMMLNNFLTSEELDKKGTWFIQSGGGNTTCVVAPRECAEIQKEIAKGLPPKALRGKIIQIALQHPAAFISAKLKLLPTFWFINLYQYKGLSTIHSALIALWYNIDDLIFIGCFLFSFYWLLTSLRTPHILITYWLSSSIALAYVLIFTFAHYETRYFIFFKLYFFVIAILAMVQLTPKPKRAASLINQNKCNA